MARRRNFHTDVHFQVGKGEAVQSFSAHKIVLSFGSPVFEAMFYRQLAEVKSPISIIDIEPEAFAIVIRYFYGEEITFDSLVSAAKVYLVADKYRVVQLKIDVDSYISRTAIKDNNQFWEIMQQDKNFFIPAMKTKCLDYFSQNSDILLNSELLLSLSLDVVKEIVQLDYLNTSEYELLSAVSLWGKGSTTAETQSNLKYFLPYIRFSCLTCKEFCKYSESYPNIIGCDDSSAILKHLCNPSNFKLPQWCCSETQKRNIKKNGPPSQSSLHTQLEKLSLFSCVFYTGYGDYEHDDDKYTYFDYGQDDRKYESDNYEYAYGDYAEDDSKYESDDYGYEEDIYDDYNHVYDDYGEDDDENIYDYIHDDDKYAYCNDNYGYDDYGYWDD